LAPTRRSSCAILDAATPRRPCDHPRTSSIVDPAAAFDAATGGSLCIRRRRPPPDFGSLVARLRGSDNVQYICLDEDSLQWLVRPGPIVVPSIAERVSELPRVVDEYVLEAVVEIEPSPRSLVLTERDRDWLIAHAATMALAEIEKTSLRLVALRSSSTLSQAAVRLGMAAVSLARWAGRRGLLTHSYLSTAA
jgi:hypothetical protein